MKIHLNKVPWEFPSVCILPNTVFACRVSKVASNDMGSTLAFSDIHLHLHQELDCFSSFSGRATAQSSLVLSSVSSITVMSALK